MQRNGIATAATIFWLVLSGFTSHSGNARGPAMAPAPNQHPRYRVLVLKCEAGIFNSGVTNNTKTKVPEDAVITLHGVEAPCTRTANGPLAPGKSIKLPGCPEAVRTCKAEAKWEIP